MATETTKPRRADPVIQFSVFTPNKVGRLHDLIRLLNAKNVHVLGLMVLDTTDSAIIRIVVDNPDGARELLEPSGAQRARVAEPTLSPDVLVVDVLA